MVRMLRLLLFAGCLSMALPVAAQTWPTPEITEAIETDAEGTPGWVMVAELGNTGEQLGMAFVCGPQGLDSAVHFGAFPDDARPVQLAVRTADDSVERFGEILIAGPGRGFHSPLLSGAEAARFLRAAMTPGALISNGYRSFWNRLSPHTNRTVRDALAPCTEDRS